jgi:hypothetical protein
MNCLKEEFQSSSFHWRATAPGNLELDIWQNLFSEESYLLRIQKPIDRAVNSFLQQWLGASPRWKSCLIASSKASALPAISWTTHA